jgi:hypothetical protein
LARRARVVASSDVARHSSTMISNTGALEPLLLRRVRTSSSSSSSSEEEEEEEEKKEDDW